MAGALFGGHYDEKDVEATCLQVWSYGGDHNGVLNKYPLMTEESLDNWVKSRRDLIALRKRLIALPLDKARRTVALALEKHPRIALDYLAKKDPTFKDRHEFSGENGEPFKIIINKMGDKVTSCNENDEKGKDLEVSDDKSL